MIATLDRKLLRDIGGMKGQILMVSLVMACGVAMNARKAAAAALFLE